ncbi:MAG: TIGR03761 family integrating conjugative element protein [Burkholderiaceae bacterium]|nr:TIGR03761 family integrating conjugative element protein [Burkholderiaceae bacterium]
MATSTSTPVPRKRTMKPALGKSRASGATAKTVRGSLENDALKDYPFESEKLAVQHLIDAAEPDLMDPLYPRYEIYVANVANQETQRAERLAREEANPEVPVDEARKARSIGALRSTEEDVMTLHTMEAMRLYLGLSPEPGNSSRFGVPGARRAASALRQLFLLSAMDNPYADWMLIQTDERVGAIKQLIEKTSNKHLKQLNDMKAKGLSYGLLEAKNPQSVSLGYHSPYGYMMSTVVVLFDHCVRVMKSAERRDLLTKKEVHEALYRIKHAIRSMFETTLKGQRVLMNDNMRGMQRSDFLPQSVDEVQKKRIDVARDIFGAVPNDIFVGTKSPRHSLRNERLDSKELRVLEAMAKAQADEEKAAATSSPLEQPAGNLID